MHPLLESFIQGVRLTGDVCADMAALLTHHGQAQTVGHGVRVGAEAKRLARRFGPDEPRAELAGWLHDISAVVPLEERVPPVRQLGLEVGVADAAVLSAIGARRDTRPG
jgi:hypothetical protein